MSGQDLPQNLGLEAPVAAQSTRGPFGFSGRGRGRAGAAHTTTSHRPSSIAAAARHNMPMGLAPPMSTRSAKLTLQPQYSATVAGTKSVDSRRSETTNPFTSEDAMPASANASAASCAHCSSWKALPPRCFRSLGHSL